jgi:uncharacterized repeat protein (TIGR03837 family)
MRFDIFCKVIDNFGDIGVTWRLARMLANEHGITVRLWLDNVAALARIWPRVDEKAPLQIVNGIAVQRWTDPLPAFDVADVVIETFQCELPAPYVEAMAARRPSPRWINLDYLSAESWVAGCHALPSPHPRLPLTKHFFFPGFDAGTGGLLLEHGLFEERGRFLADRRALMDFWRGLGIGPPSQTELRVSVFCYQGAPIADLVDIWARSPGPITALMPEGQAADALCRRFPNGGGAHPWIERGNARLKIVPFLDQVGFDRLLWACDINFVRGEDSFVRAQWAQHPLVWNIYPQGENTHWIKLNAFLDRYLADIDEATAQSVRHLWRVWNGMVRPAELASAWQQFVGHRAAIERHTAQWAQRLAALEGLAASLVRFCSTAA